MSNLLLAYNDLSEKTKAAIWFAVCNFLQKGFQFISIFIFTKILLPEEFGYYTLYLSWFAIISLIATISLYSDTFNVGYSKTANKNTLYYSLLSLSFFITTVLCCLTFIFKSYIPYICNIDNIIIILFFLQIFGFATLEFWSARQRFEYKYVKLFFVTSLQVLFTIFLAVYLVLYYEASSYYLILSTSFGYIFVGIYILYDDIRKNFFSIDLSIWRYAISFAIPLLPHYFSYMALAQADRVIIGNLVGITAAGIFGVAYQLSQIVTLIRISLNASFVPWLYKKLKSKNIKDIRYFTEQIAIFLLSLIIFFMFIIPEILLLFTSESYIDSKWIMPPLVLSAYFMYIFTLYINIELFFERNHFVMIASVLCAILNIILDYLLLPDYGYFIISYKTLICYILLALGHYYICKKTLMAEIEIYNNYFFLKLSVVGIIMMAICLILYNFDNLRYIMICLLLMVFIFKRDYFKSIYFGFKQK